MPDDALRAELERLRKENAEKSSAPQGKSITFKVSEKGGLSVYGLGRFPVTLYKDQWVRLLAVSDQIREFIRANEAQLKARE